MEEEWKIIVDKEASLMADRLRSKRDESHSIWGFRLGIFADATKDRSEEHARRLWQEAKARGIAEELLIDDDGSAALLAVKSFKADMFSFLVEEGFSLSNSKVSPILKKTALILATENGSEWVEKLLHAGADPNEGLSSGHTPLLAAVRTGDCEMVEALLKFGAVATATDGNENYPLLEAFSEEFDDVAAKILEFDGEARIMMEDRERFPLSEASKRDMRKTMRQLLRSGSDAKAKDADGRSALHYASSAETVETLLGAGCELESIDDSETTPLLASIRDGRIEASIALLEAGADWRKRSFIGSSDALSEAIMRGYETVVAKMLDLGAVLPDDPPKCEESMMDFMEKAKLRANLSSTRGRGNSKRAKV